VIPRSRSGRLDLVIEGIDVNSKTVASATAQTLIVVGDKVAVPVVLAAGPLLCGNGTIDPGESCDDGNLISFDGCDFRCQAESALPDAGPVDTARGLDVVPDARLDVSISDVSLDIVASDSTRLLDVTTLPEVAGVEVGRDVSPPQTDLDAAMPDFAVPTEPGPDLPLPNADGPAADVPPDIPSLSTLDAVGDLLPPPDAPTQAPSFRVIGEFVPGGFSAGATYKVIGRFVPFSGTTKGQTWGIGPL
jgi:cysteine-rich repeat protein